MKDTKEEIKEKQLELFRRMACGKSFILGADFFDFGKFLIENSIRNSQPEISKAELKAEVFRRCYKGKFKEEVLEDICRNIKIYFLKKDK